MSEKEYFWFLPWTSSNEGQRITWADGKDYIWHENENGNIFLTPIEDA